jgi:hypothetical protein
VTLRSPPHRVEPGPGGRRVVDVARIAPVLVGLLASILPGSSAAQGEADSGAPAPSTSPQALPGPIPAPQVNQVEACIDASARGQTLRNRGQLIEANRQFVFCSTEACPGPIRADCSQWLAEVRARLPSVVLRVRDADGRDVFDAFASIDGKPVAQDAGGRAMSIDPGPHVIRVEREGSQPVEERIMAREGEKYRALDFVLKPLPAPAPVQADASGGGIPIASWVLGGVGVAGVIAFGVLAAGAKSDRDELRDTCAPGCDVADVDAVRDRLLFANLSLGVGIAALGVATWVALSSSDESDSASTPVGVAPSARGALAVVRGRF